MWTLPSEIDSATHTHPGLAAFPPEGGWGFQGRPTTDFVGWRRLHLTETINLKRGEFFILVIPDDHKGDRHKDRAIRQKFLKRLFVHLKKTRPDLKRQSVLEHLRHNHGIS